MIEKLQGYYDRWTYDFDINRKITLLCGDSGTGKTRFYELCQQRFRLENDFIRLCDGLIQKDVQETLNDIKVLHNQLFIFEHADMWTVTDEIRYSILASNNQFIIIGRNPIGLLLFPNNMKQIKYSLSERQAWFDNALLS